MRKGSKVNNTVKDYQSIRRSYFLAGQQTFDLPTALSNSDNSVIHSLELKTIMAW